MITVESTTTFDASAAAVFAVLTDLEARATWLSPGILEDRVTPAGPARLGTSLFEAGKYSGFKSEKTMIVTEFEQGRLLTLATPPEVRESFRESYRLEPLSAQSCRLHVTVEVGGAPKLAEFFMRQSLTREQAQAMERLKSVLANWALETR